MAEAGEIEDSAADPTNAGEVAGESASRAAPEPPAKTGGKLGLILGLGLVTLVAGGLGAGLGIETSAKIEHALTARAKALPPADRAHSATFSGDALLQPLEPIITNLASPSDTWIRLETAIVFNNGAVKSPQVTAAEIRQDIVAYARTITLAQLEGPSALQHLREDLNERVAVRTGGLVNELVIQSLIVQ